ncbi:MAG: hypothetical protein AB7I48_25610, partial [Planctomycetaceae bacterium]
RRWCVPLLSLLRADRAAPPAQVGRERSETLSPSAFANLDGPLWVTPVSDGGPPGALADARPTILQDQRNRS